MIRTCVTLTAFVTAHLIAMAAAESVIWRVDNLTNIGGHPVTVVGSPTVVRDHDGSSVAFNGASDGLFLDVNPIAGLNRFTIEAIVNPAADGPEEQRFLHFQEAATENRALLEIRQLAGRWCLDTFLRSPEPGLALLDRTALHATGEWHAAALVYDGQTMSHFVNGVREASGAVVFDPLKAGRASIGVRQNKISWFKGRIRLIRISPEALSPERLLTRDAK